MPRSLSAVSSRRANHLVELTRDLLRERTLPVASTSQNRIQLPTDGPNVAWLPSANSRSPGKAVLKRLDPDRPRVPKHFYRFAPELGLQEFERRIEPEFGSRSRYLEHKRRTLASDLLYLTYDHHLARNPPPDPAREPDNPMNPRFLGHMRNARIGRRLLPKARAVTPDEPLSLKAIHLDFTYLPAYTNKTRMLPVVGALRAITGISPEYPGEPHRNASLKLTYTTGRDRRKGMRMGVPIGVHVKLVGQLMEQFIETLVEVVLPRWRNFKGFPLPRIWSERRDAMGVYQYTLSAEALPYFPQLEVNADRYPHFADLRMVFVSSARGPGAMARTLSLLSGYRIPFVPFFKQEQEATFDPRAAAAAAAASRGRGPKQKSQKKNRAQ